MNNTGRNNLDSTLLIFLDGVGIGRADKSVNPFFKYPFSFLSGIFGKIPHLDDMYLTSDNKTFLFPSDACMGIGGLPQSGTGQTSIFCGVNAPEIIGRHFGPYPYSTLVPIINEKNIFKEFIELGLSVQFVNAYPQKFFDYVNSGRRRLNFTTLSCILSEIRLNNYEDLKIGQALSAEIDNSRWVNKLNYDLPIITPELAASRLLEITSKNHLTVFEYFFTDHIGHGRNVDTFEEILGILDKFLFFILKNINQDVSLVICSDHGNLEDISVKTHTLNPALTITAGKDAQKLMSKIKYLSDIKPAIMGRYQ
ncbi:MAG: metalloenzyme [Ignavibacteria bacterium]